eukprot:TRINITY_DN14727_c0_g1_i1.p1 TRINITY_DN14727_c0_g1~~TRINITY_DN14727_c0_g1_i1.p1  ORF type:complete len:361 (-),score=33.62 TRINITY_DN14727_c0_g1_i1:130-1212(-)
MTGLEELWEKSGYITSIGKLYLLGNKKYTHTEIKNFLDKQQVNQLHRRAPKKLDGHITAFIPNEMWQIDLLDFQKSRRRNGGHTFILICVDVFSRKAFARGLKGKTGPVVRNALADIFGNEAIPKKIVSDNGPEFVNVNVQGLFKTFFVYHSTNEVGDHKALGIIDRFSRTFRERLEKYFDIKRTTVWVDYIEKLIASYNSTPHRSLGNMTPNDVAAQNPIEILERNIDKSNSVTQDRIKVGDRVRRRLKKTVFDKGTKQRWTKTTYIVKRVMVVNVILDDGTKYRIEDLIKVDSDSIGSVGQNIEREEDDSLAASDRALADAPPRLRSEIQKPGFSQTLQESRLARRRKARRPEADRMM